MRSVIQSPDALSACCWRRSSLGRLNREVGSGTGHRVSQRQSLARRRPRRAPRGRAPPPPWCHRSTWNSGGPLGSRHLSHRARRAQVPRDRSAPTVNSEAPRDSRRERCPTPIPPSAERPPALRSGAGARARRRPTAPQGLTRREKCQPRRRARSAPRTCSSGSPRNSTGSTPPSRRWIRRHKRPRSSLSPPFFRPTFASVPQGAEVAASGAGCASAARGGQAGLNDHLLIPR